VEGIYKITVKFVIETLVEGFESGRKNQNHLESNKETTTSNNANDNGANTTQTTHNGGDSSCNSTKAGDAS
jgi:hypothetical protein